MSCCDRLNHLDRDELIAVLKVRLSRLTAEELKVINQFMMSWQQVVKT